MNAPSTMATPARLPWILGGVAALFFLLPGILGPYGVFIDEFYYRACSERLAAGYVDHPPLAPWILRASRTVLGDGMLALRLPPALAGGLTVVLAGRLARRLGARATGQWLACGAVALAPVLQILFGVFSMNAFSILIWLALAIVLVEIEERGAPRLWLAFGALAGVGILSKHTIVLFALALAVALPLTPARRHLKSPWLWGGLALALLVALPNLLWQQANDWLSLEFYRAADGKNVATPVGEAVLLQVLTQGLSGLPIALAGLLFYVQRQRAHLRHIGLLCAALFLLMVFSGKSRPDRIAGIYPILFAAGGALWDGWLARERLRWLRVALPAWMIATALALLPLGQPVLPPPALAAYAQATGIVPQIEAGDGKASTLPQWFADRLGWEAFVRDVDDALDAVGGPEERRATPIFCPSYGHAGALEMHAAELGIERAYSTHNTYFLWGPPTEPFEVALVVGNSEEFLRQLFEEVELFRRTDCEYAMPWRDGMPIWIVAGPKADLVALWPQMRSFA